MVLSEVTAWLFAIGELLEPTGDTDLSTDESGTRQGSVIAYR